MNAQSVIEMLPTEEAAKLRGSGPLSSRPYWDPDWWELERKAIFLRTWLHIGHLCEVPESGSFIRRAAETLLAARASERAADRALAAS